MAKKKSTKAAGKKPAAKKPAAKPKSKATPQKTRAGAKTSGTKTSGKSSGKGRSTASSNKPAARPTKPAARPVKSKTRSGPTKIKPPGKPRGEKKTSLKISKPPATAIAHQNVEPPEPPTTAQLRKADSGLTRHEKDQYRKALMEKRAEILGDVESLKDAALSSTGNLSNMPLHMADVGSDQYEQEAMLGLVESERRLLREINEALQRLHEGTYGVCAESGKPIGKPRLDATPWAKYTIEVVREKERQGRP